MGDWKKCLKERSIFYVKRVTVCKEAIPPQAMINNLEMDEAPFEELNTLELHLISPILLFYKIVLLPKSDQRAVHGPVLCVKSGMTKTTNILPRNINDESFIKVKLKKENWCTKAAICSILCH